MVKLSDSDTYFEFVQSCAVSLIHFWADWNAHDYQMKDRLKELEASYSGLVCFASVDVSINVGNKIFGEIKIINVPALAYHKNGNYIETVIGLTQPIEEKLNKLLAEK